MKKVFGKITNFLGRFFKKASDDSLSAYAAQVTFFVLLSFFPFLFLVIMLASRFSLSSESVILQIMEVVPEQFHSFIFYIIDDIENSDNYSYTLISLLVSLWSAGKGIQAMTYGLNKIYEVEKRGNYFIVRLLSALYTFLFAVMCMVIMIVHVFGTHIGNAVVERWPDLKQATILILSMKSAFTLIILFFTFLVLYYQLPGRKGRIKHEATGACFAALAWMLLTEGFSLFIKYSANASYMYGSLTSVILIIIWLYIGMQIILFGAEINYHMTVYIASKTPQDTN